MKVVALFLAFLAVAAVAQVQADEVLDLVNTQPEVANVGDGSDPNQVQTVSCKSCDDGLSGEEEIEHSPDVIAAEQQIAVTDEQVSIAQGKVTKALECSGHLDEKNEELKELMKRWNKMGDKLKNAKLIAKLDQEREVVSHVDQMARVLKTQVNSLNQAEGSMSSKLKLTESAIGHANSQNAANAIGAEVNGADSESVEQIKEEKEFGYDMAKQLGKQIDEIHTKNIANLQTHMAKSSKLIFENGPANLQDSTVKSGVLNKLVEIGPDGKPTGKVQEVNTLTGTVKAVPEFMFRTRSRHHKAKKHHKH